VGALDPARLKIFLERYETFEDDIIPKFHYGCHYSTAGIVLYFLIRMVLTRFHAVNMIY
jgi:hypothetical protein